MYRPSPLPRDASGTILPFCKGRIWRPLRRAGSAWLSQSPSSSPRRQRLFAPLAKGGSRRMRVRGGPRRTPVEQMRSGTPRSPDRPCPIRQRRHASALPSHFRCPCFTPRDRPAVHVLRVACVGLLCMFFALSFASACCTCPSRFVMRRRRAACWQPFRAMSRRASSGSCAQSGRCRLPWLARSKPGNMAISACSAPQNPPRRLVVASPANKWHRRGFCVGQSACGGSSLTRIGLGSRMSGSKV
jgi:hypothetical protein